MKKFTLKSEKGTKYAKEITLSVTEPTEQTYILSEHIPRQAQRVQTNSNEIQALRILLRELGQATEGDINGINERFDAHKLQIMGAAKSITSLMEELDTLRGHLNYENLIKDQIEPLEKENRQLKARLEALESAQQALDKKIGKRLSNLEPRSNEHSKRIEAHQDTMAFLEEDIDTLKEILPDVNRLNIRLHSLQQRIDKFSLENHPPQDSPPGIPDTQTKNPPTQTPYWQPFSENTRKDLEFAPRARKALRDLRTYCEDVDISNLATHVTLGEFIDDLLQDRPQ